MFFWDVFQQIVWFLREIYDIAHIALIAGELDFLCNLNYITPTSIYE